MRRLFIGGSRTSALHRRRMMQSPGSEDVLSKPTPMQKPSILYDFNSKIKINTPREMMPDIYDFLIPEVALAVVVSHALFHHESWWNLRWPLFYESRRPFIVEPPDMWDSDEAGRRECMIFTEISGRFRNLITNMEGLTPVHEITKYCGCVGRSRVVLEYETSTFISPAILNDTDHNFFERHNFDICFLPDTLNPVGLNLCNILEEHKEKDLKSFNHDLAWSKAVDNILDAPGDYENID